MMDFNINIEMSDQGTPEVELRLQFGPSMIEQINAKVIEVYERYGPERDVGPITFVIREGKFVEVLIGTQKQGDLECFLDEYGNLVESNS